MGESENTENPYQADPIGGSVESATPTKWFGIAAITFGLIGMVASILSYHFFEEKPARSQSHVTIDLGIVKWEKKSATPPPERGIRDLVAPFHMRMVGVAFGSCAVALSLVSWYRGEGIWLGLGGCVFAVAAVAWVWFVCAFAILLLSGGLFTFIPAQSSTRAPA